MKTFTIIYYEQPFSGPGDYFRATVVAEDYNAAFAKFRDEHPVYESESDDTDGVDSELETVEDAPDLPERIDIVCAIEGDLEVFWDWD